MIVPIGKVKSNPSNPRVIKDSDFQDLVQSIKEFPEMLKLRPIVVNDDMIVLGGNQRLKACKEAGLKEVHIMKASELTPEQQKRFMIVDNKSSGKWDWKEFNNGEWDKDQLIDWGLEFPKEKDDKSFKAMEEDDIEFNDQITSYKRNAVFKSTNKYGIPDITPEMLYSGSLAGLETWATTSEDKGQKFLYVFQNVSIAKIKDHKKILLSFYCRDDKFERLFEEPNLYMPKFLEEGFFAAITPNYTLYAEDPYAWRLYRTFKSRWIGVYLAKAGIPIIPDIEFSMCESMVDLEYVLCGIPRGPKYISIQLQQTLKENEKAIWESHIKKVVEVLKPETIICYCDKYAEFIQGCVVKQKFIFLKSINHQLQTNFKTKNKKEVQ